MNKLTSRPRANRSLCRDTRGLSTVEYIILLALVAIVGITAWRSFGTKVGDQVTKATDQIKNL